MKSAFVMAMLFLATVIGCESKTAPASVPSYPTTEHDRIARFFEVRPGATLHLALVVIEGDHYQVLTDQQHEKAAVLHISDNGSGQPVTVHTSGFFVRSKDEWQRDPRQEFEMQGGVWLLDRFLTVVQRAQKENRFQVVNWN